MSDSANAALAGPWKDLWNGDLSLTGKIIAEDFIAHAAPITGTGPDEIRGREALKGWIRASALLNSDVCLRYPQIIKAGLARNWAWLAHGKDNSTFQAGMSADQERMYLADVVDTIEKATGHRPRGWMGPGLTETFQTPGLLADLGLSYVLDWTNDDQPYALNVAGMLSVPYSVELNDVGPFVAKSLRGPDFVQMVRDQLDQLYADAAGGGRVMALALHPFVIGQAFRLSYLDQALEYVASHPGVWLTTSDEIAEHYVSATDTNR